VTTPGSDAALPDEAAPGIWTGSHPSISPSASRASTTPTPSGAWSPTAVEAGLRKRIPELRALICASDSGSTDGTVQAFLAGGVGDDAEQLLIPPDTRPIEKTAFMSTW
jgi:hypothetical protein